MQTLQIKVVFHWLLDVQISEASNYNPEANSNDGSCQFSINGCTNELAVNFNPFANVLDESCLFTGCTDRCSEL